MRTPGAVLIPAALIAALAGSVPARSADLGTATVSRGSPRFTWTGGPFLASNPAGCRNPTHQANLCDVLLLEVDAPDRWNVSIEISTATASDNYDFWVNWGGEFIGGGFHETSQERFVVVHRSARRGSPYRIYIEPIRVAPNSTYIGVVRLHPNVERSPVPAGAGHDSGVSLATNFAYSDGSDLDFDGRYVYAGQYGDDGGIHIIDTAPRIPERVGFVPCGGYQNDVAAVRPGLVALGYHSSVCGSGAGRSGLRLVDVSDPARPRIAGFVDFEGGAHTITAVPGTALVYASPGGGGPYVDYWSNDTPKAVIQQEVIVDVSDPNHPKIVRQFDPNGLGCHDVSFHAGRKLGFCAGTQETLIWDVSDPLEPLVVGRIANGAFFHHSAVASPDGLTLVIGDEAWIAHECAARGPTGALWVYDISDPAQPAFRSYIGPPRGDRPIGDYWAWTGTWCTAHNYNFIPGTDILVGAWYAGGTAAIDLADAARPQEIAFFRPPNAEAWSSYWFAGRIWISDIARGLDVVELTSRPWPEPAPAGRRPATRVKGDAIAATGAASPLPVAAAGLWLLSSGGWLLLAGSRLRRPRR